MIQESGTKMIKGQPLRAPWTPLIALEWDWNKDGVIEQEPILKIETLVENDKQVLVMDVGDDHTGGAILRPTNAFADK